MLQFHHSLAIPESWSEIMGTPAVGYPRVYTRIEWVGELRAVWNGTNLAVMNCDILLGLKMPFGSTWRDTGPFEGKYFCVAQLLSHIEIPSKIGLPEVPTVACSSF